MVMLMALLLIPRVSWPHSSSSLHTHTQSSSCSACLVSTYCVQV